MFFCLSETITIFLKTSNNFGITLESISIVLFILFNFILICSVKFVCFIQSDDCKLFNIQHICTLFQNTTDKKELIVDFIFNIKVPLCFQFDRCMVRVYFGRVELLQFYRVFLLNRILHQILVFICTVILEFTLSLFKFPV